MLESPVFPGLLALPLKSKLEVDLSFNVTFLPGNVHAPQVRLANLRFRMMAHLS